MSYPIWLGNAAIAVWWTCTGAVVYTWAVYPQLLRIARVFRRRGSRSRLITSAADLPTVSIVVTVHNEASVICRRLENCLALKYPEDRMEIIVASDNSSDGTNALVEQFPATRVRLVQSKGVGKSAAQNEAVRTSAGEIVVLTDARSLFDQDFLEQLLPAFDDPTIGCAVGALHWSNTDQSPVAKAGNIYWRYEQWIWRVESDLDLLCWASGPCMAFRRELFVPMQPRFGDDCVIPLSIRSQGYRVVYCAAAKASDEWPASPRREFRARTRMTLRSFSGTLHFPELMNPWHYGSLAYAIISHKILRWLTPAFLLAAFLSGITLWDSAGIRLVWLIEAGVLILAAVGGLTRFGGRRLPVASHAHAFVVSQAAMLLGVGMALRGAAMTAYAPIDGSIRGVRPRYSRPRKSSGVQEGTDTASKYRLGPQASPRAESDLP